MKRTLLSVFACLAFASFGQMKYSKTKIYTDYQGLQQLAELGLPVDHGTIKSGSYIISDFSEVEIEAARNAGFTVEVIIDDVKAYYLSKEHQENVTEKNASCSGGGNSGSEPVTPSNFDVNTQYAGFYKYDEMLAELDAMATQYPNLITTKMAIPFPAGGATGEEFQAGLTWEGRPIYHVKISDNPNTEEAEPEVLYTAIHHAREPLSMSQTIYYMWYLLENYGTDPEVTYLVDNTEMYFVPCINPDGYIENETADPNGAGMHRKNKNPHVGTFNPGVDLNRNYSYGWNTTGVSSNENNDTYPGRQAFSEPETSAMKYLMENHTFISAFNAHTYGNTLLHPIGTTSAEFADHHDYFADLTTHMCSQNGYFPQKSSGLYPASGDSDDYEYKVDIGVGLKDTVFAMTPEVGSDFWPGAAEVIPSCQDMLLPNLVLSHMAHRYLVVTETDPSTITAMSGDFNHDYQRLGLEDGVVNVSIQPLLNIQSVGTGIDYDVAVRATGSGAISYTLDPAIQGGDLVKYVLEIDNGTWIKRDTITKVYGTLNLQVFEDGSTTNWTGNWNTTTNEFYSPSTSYTESPSGDYGNNWTRTYQYNQTIDLTNATSASLSFYGLWEIEADYDYVQLQVSTNGGGTWIGQCGNYTVDGTSANGSAQPNGEPVWEGTQSSWVLEEISLSDYLGQQIDIRFIMESDGGLTMGGFHFDDFSIFYTDETPAPPVANFSSSSTDVCLGESISFTDQSSGVPNSWSWDFGDSESSTEADPSHTYTQAGTYTVTLTVSNNEGQDTYTMNNIVVNETTDVTIAADDNLVCINHADVTFTTTENGPSGTGVISGPGVSGGVLSPSTAGVGTHTVTYTYTNSNGCVTSDQTTVTVDACASIEAIEDQSIVVYPNPSKGSFTISGIKEGTTYKILDINGREMSFSKTIVSDEQVHVSGIAEGTYFIQTSNGKDVATIRLVILD